MYSNSTYYLFDDDTYNLSLTWFWYSEEHHYIIYDDMISSPPSFINRNGEYCFDMGDGWMRMSNIPYEDMIDEDEYEEEN